MTEPGEGDAGPGSADSGDRGPRLQAYLAACGLASRRACEDIIRAGRVLLDGRVVTELGTRVPPGARVEVDGKPANPETRKRYLALNKPAGVLSAASDPHGRPVAVDLLKPEVTERVYNVGRLDYDSEGLLLFTNDGEFAGAVGHPSGNIEKEYRVRTDRPVPEGFAKAFLRGIPEGGQILRARSVEAEDERTLRVTPIEGRNREIRRALAAFGLAAVRLVRVRVGPVTLEGLRPGAWRDLTEPEKEALRNAAPDPASNPFNRSRPS